MRRQSRDVQVTQNALNTPKRLYMTNKPSSPFIGQVRGVHTDRMTCDILTPDGQHIDNVAVMTTAGLVDGAPYGEMCLPAIDDYVIVMYASYGNRHKVIAGTMIPYLSNEFTKDVVNSASKAFTKKLLEADKPLEYRRIFKSGVSVQIEGNGSVTVETPNGSYVNFDNASGDIVVKDENGNDITMTTGKVTINGNLEVAQ